VKGKIAIVLGFVVAVLAIVLFTRGRDTTAAGSAEAGAAASKDDGAGATTAITMLYSTEKKEWIEWAAASFRKAHPEIDLTLIGRGSLAAAEDIVSGKEKPTIFSPADTLVLNLATSDWKTKGDNGDLVAASGDDAPQSLVITPLVFVVWEDRAQVLLKASKGVITWKSLRKAIASNQGWPAIGGNPAWGFVKLGQTDPTQSNSGLQALYLMSLEYYAKPQVEVGDLLKPDYQAFVGDIEKGVSTFESSTGTFMTDMVRFGPSKYDISVVYENLAISQIENAQGRWGNLRVYYPQQTLWSDHPAAILQGSWVTPAQKAAARTWLAHLRSREAQERALSFGFRPGDPSVPVKTSDPSNPFTRLAQFGVQVDIPPVAKTPDGSVVRNLMTMWTRIVKH
jgi:ABC-type molybdate transport system substrate-binding protein